MKITQKDADELSKLEFYLFYFNIDYRNNLQKACSPQLMTQLLTLLDFLPDKGITFPHYNWQGKICTKEELKNYIKNGHPLSIPIDYEVTKRENKKFFNRLVGEDIGLLEDLFEYATPNKSSSYFFRKNLLLPDFMHKSYISNLMAGQFSLGVKTSSLNIDFIIRVSAKIIKDKSIFQKYYDSILEVEQSIDFKNKDRQEYYLQDLLIQKIITLIIFERPILELEQLLRAYKTMLGTKKLKVFISQLDSDNRAKIEHYAVDIPTVFELSSSPLIEKMYTIPIEPIALSYQKTINNIQKTLSDYLQNVASELGVQYYALPYDNLKVHKFIISAENHSFIVPIITDMINSPQVFNFEKEEFNHYIQISLQQRALKDSIHNVPQRKVSKL